MIAILSPAKNMLPVVREDLPLSRPASLEQTAQLAALFQGYAAWELESLMKINAELAFKAYLDFQSFSPEAPGTAALLTYHGLAFQHLNAHDFSLDDLAFANQYVRILSAFYGLLRPLDGIVPYRLELQCKAKINGKSLYAFWGDRFYRALFAEQQPVINLASLEYSKAISPYLQPSDRWLTCQFLVCRAGKWKALATESKMARGEMVRWIVQNRIQKPEALRDFTWQNYHFAPLRSNNSVYVFTKEWE